MSVSVKFDSVEIVGATYTPRFIKHESPAIRLLSTSELVREDGGILISDRRGEKTITCQGYLIGSSVADLESKIEIFKELFSRQEKNLDIVRSEVGIERRYIATCVKHEFDRDHFNNSYVPWIAEFIVLTGEGRDISATIPVNDIQKDTTIPATGNFSIAGSKPPKPTIELEVDYWDSDVIGIQWENLDTGEKLIVTKNTTWSPGEKVTIYCDEKVVKENVAQASELETKFYGSFPTMKIGTNNYRITAGGIVCQQNYAAADAIDGMVDIDATTKYRAQSLMIPYTDNTVRGIGLVLKKTGSPGNITWRIETDNGGEPSGSLVDANATGTITAASLTTSAAWKTNYGAGAFSLTANTQYWIVIYIASGDVSNYVSLGVENPGEYTKGFYSSSNDSGGTWTPAYTTDMYFRLLFGGMPDSSGIRLTVSYNKTYL